MTVWLSYCCNAASEGELDVPLGLCGRCRDNAVFMECCAECLSTLKGSARGTWESCTCEEVINGTS